MRKQYYLMTAHQAGMYHVPGGFNEVFDVSLILKEVTCLAVSSHSVRVQDSMSFECNCIRGFAC